MSQYYGTPGHIPPPFTADATSTVCLKSAAEQKADRLPVNDHREGEVQACPLFGCYSHLDTFWSTGRERQALVASRELTSDHVSKTKSRFIPKPLHGLPKSLLKDFSFRAANADTVHSNAGTQEDRPAGKQACRKGPILQALSKRGGRFGLRVGWVCFAF